MEHQNQKTFDNEQDHNMKDREQCNPSVSELKTSMSALIIWNITKAVEKNPHIDLKASLKAAEERLERDAHDVTSIISQHADERHLACALLAWQHLGHNKADSLSRFLETRQNEQICGTSKEPSDKDFDAWFGSDFPAKPISSCRQNEQDDCSKSVMFNNFDVHSLIGPVMKLPTMNNEAKVVMRLENSQNQRASPMRAKSKNISTKIDEACCIESACVERLAALGASTGELRKRAAQLARREADRSELLERAEAAWKDLELGYQRRLSDAAEKEEDLIRQSKKLFEERNGYKNACMTLVPLLKEKGVAADDIHQQLMNVEKEVCERACARLHLSEESAREDAILADQQCKAAQLDRDLQFKEEQAHRKLQALESEVGSAQALIFEAERAMRSELNALKEQVALVSKQLLAEDADSNQLCEQLKELNKEKMELVEDLDGCKVMCDKRMQGKNDELKNKRNQLAELKAKVVACRCKLPVDEAVEVKRTPSLAALCKCSPDDRLLESRCRVCPEHLSFAWCSRGSQLSLPRGSAILLSCVLTQKQSSRLDRYSLKPLHTGENEATCSCTSLRSSLLSNMLADLFSGLQSELGCTGSEMPCQLLKCLDDRHNWDRASLIKSNLRNYFSKLLVGELDIAIATSIEKCHARWVGSSCVDAARPTKDVGGVETEDWQQRAVERRAQALASELAEKMFEEKKELIMKKAKEVITSGPPPCECSSKPQTALYPCLLDRIQPLCGRDMSETATPPESTISPKNWKRTHKDVILLRAQIEDLKKESVKKEDLKSIEKKFTRLIQRSSVPDKIEVPSLSKGMSSVDDSIKRDRSIIPLSMDRLRSNAKYNRQNLVKKKPSNINGSNTIQYNYTSRVSGYPKNILKTPMNQASSTEKQSPKYYKRPGQSFAVNLCLCGANKDLNKITPLTKPIKSTNRQSVLNETDKFTAKTKEFVRIVSSSRQSNPIAPLPAQENVNYRNSKRSSLSCQSDCVCFHKIPSNTSIDNLIKTLSKWKCDFTDPLEGKCKKDAILLEGSFSDGNYIRTQDDTHLKPKIESNISNYVSSKNYTPFSFNLSDQMEETTEVSHQVPAITDSEYIGTINLDKSNEKICKCSVLDSCFCCNKTSKDKSAIDALPKREIQIKKQDDVEPMLNHDINQEHSKGDFQNAINTSRKQVANFITDDRNEKKTVLEVNRVESIKYLGGNTSNADTVNKKSELCPCDSDYRVKFLGVTLTNATSKDKGPKIHKDDIYCSANSKEPQYEKVRIDHNFNTMQSRASKFAEYGKSNSFGVACNELPTCQCNVNFDAFRHFFDNTLQFGDHRINIDKALDAQSFLNENIREQEPCVCCKIGDSKEPNELEVNTFQLLEQHLKEKLEEIKLNCQSECISPDLENTLLSTIALKVKQLIIQNTSKVVCKCPNEYKSKGSWNRAFSLLQEYLKAKIKHAQCLSKNENNEDVLPDITHKICVMIKNDFEQLKNHCKCKDFDKLSDQCSIEKEQLIDQLPKMDAVILKTEELMNNPEAKQSGHISNKLYNPKETISSQVSNNLKMDSKSCEVMKKDIQKMKTVGTRKSSTIAYSMCSESKCCQCQNITSVENNLPYQRKEMLRDRGTIALRTDDIDHVTLSNKIDIKNVLVDAEGSESTNHSAQKTEHKAFLVEKEKKSILHESKNQDNENDTIKNYSPILPYIGYTVDCSCAYNLGHCVCSKSIFQGNNNEINEFWKSLENSSINKANTSYILDNVYEKKEDQMNFIEVAKDSYVNNMPRRNYSPSLKTRDNTTSAHNDAEIFLKDSKDKCHSPKHNTTNTHDNDLVSNETDYATDDNLDWYECGSQFADDRKLKMVHFPLGNNLKQTKSDVIPRNVNEKSFKKFSDCACTMVPICHVKMLMENIEDKLINSECTCDSLSSKVCPVHGKLLFHVK